MSELNYSDLVASMPVAYSMHEMIYNDKGEAVDYLFLDVNKAFEELTGMVSTEVIGKTVLQLMPETENYWIQKYAECVRTGERIYYENFSRSLNRFYQVVAFKNADKQFVTIFLDITDRKDEFKKADEVANFYQTITENGSDGVVIIDETNRYSYVSPNALKMFGYEKNEIPNLIPDELCHPDDVDFVSSEILKTFQNPDFKPTLEYRFRKKNGDWLWIESKISNLLQNSIIKGIVINFKNITERRAKEQKLKQSEALLAATLSHSRFSIWSVDRNYKLLYANDTFKQEFLQSFGVKLFEGINIVEILPSPLKSLWLSRYDRVFQNQSFVEEDTIDFGTHNIFIEVSTTPIVVDGEVVGASFYGENITNRKMAELQLVQTSENLSKLLNVSNEFVKPKTNEIDFDKIIETLRLISGANYLVFNYLKENYSQALAITGLKNPHDIIKKYLNIDFTSKRWARNKDFESKWIGEKFTVYDDFGKVLKAEFNALLVDALLFTFNIGKVIIVRIDGNNNLIGNLILIFEKGKDIQNSAFVEMFTFQLGQYLERLNAEEALTIKISEMERFHKLTINRELNMIELKKEVNELLKQAGKDEKYRIVN